VPSWWRLPSIASVPLRGQQARGFSCPHSHRAPPGALGCPRPGLWVWRNGARLVLVGTFVCVWLFCAVLPIPFITVWFCFTDTGFRHCHSVTVYDVVDACAERGTVRAFDSTIYLPGVPGCPFRAGVSTIPFFTFIVAFRDDTVLREFPLMITVPLPLVVRCFI